MTRTIVHTYLDVILVNQVKQITKSVWNINQEQKYLQRHPIRLTESDHDYILNKIKHR